MIFLYVSCSKVVDVSGIYSIQDSFLEAVAHTCPDLTSLGVAGCWRVTNTAVRYAFYVENEIEDVFVVVLEGAAKVINILSPSKSISIEFQSLRQFH